MRESAHELLAKHAEERDIADIVRSLHESLDDDGHTYVEEAVTALRRFPGVGWLPGVERAYVELRCATCREEVVKSLAVLDRERFVRTYARECLWDCNEATIRLGIEHAPLDEPFVRERLEELARGPAWFERETADAARARLAAGG